jgi:dihydropteroate synthase
MTVLDCGGRTLDLSRCRVMGILNITPDSFSDGGDFFCPETALARARDMVDAGAAIIDVGGESTRPGATAVSADEEIRRVVPVIEAIHAHLSVPVSIDTSKPAVMYAAVQAGAGMINDVRALREEGALAAVAELGVPVCLMHMQGEPRSMQQAPHYDDVVAEVKSFLLERVEACERAGIQRHQLVLDPGFGFGKDLNHNLQLLQELSALVAIGLPVLVGMSRKSMIGKILDNDVDQRLYGSMALAALAAWQGSVLIRAHDVRATVEAVRVIDAVRSLSQLENLSR